MPWSYNYLIEKAKFDKRLLSELQHRIRVPLKCYTVSEFKLLEENKFEFKKTNRKMISGRNMTILDKKVHHGSYLKEEFTETHYRITLTFYD